MPGLSRRPPSCPEQLAALDQWLATAKSDAAKGAVMSADIDRLVSIPLKKGAAPAQPAMTLVVDKDGLHDGNKPARPVEDAKALIEANTNIAFARSNPNAIWRTSTAAFAHPLGCTGASSPPPRSTSCAGTARRRARGRRGVRGHPINPD